jgi:hypothetical protein
MAEQEKEDERVQTSRKETARADIDRVPTLQGIFSGKVLSDIVSRCINKITSACLDCEN